MINGIDDILGKMDNEGNIDTTTQPVEPVDVSTADQEVIEPNETTEPDVGTQETDPQADPNAEGTGGEDEGDSKDKSGNDNKVIRTLRTNIKESKQEVERLRVEAEAERKVLEKIAHKRNITVDQLKKEMEEEDLAEEAKTKNMTPEALSEMKRLQQEMQQMREETQRKEFNSRVESFQKHIKLNDDETMEFLRGAQEIGINLLNPNLKLENVYFAMNKDAVEASIREDERQKVLRDIEEQKTKGPTGTKRNGTGDESSKKGIDDLYKDLAKLDF